LQIGPFKIVKKVLRVIYKLRIPELTRYLTFHISLLKEVPKIVLLAKKAEELLEEEYEVEVILDKRKRG
jgi:hypothetical protein